MKKISFTKMSASGNDFVVIEGDKLRPVSFGKLAKLLCERRAGVGADGLLVLGKSLRADFRMRIFNADGSEAEMCGNGLRCAALYARENLKLKKHILMAETIAGIYEVCISGKDKVKIKMLTPKNLKSGVPIKINNRALHVDYIDTGVPHAVVFVHGIDNIDVESIGRDIRRHENFRPQGTNADFVEIIDDRNIKMRTYERGVEGETLACGTGAVASAIAAYRASRITHHASRNTKHETNVHAKGGLLKVHFKNTGSRIEDVYLEGQAREVFTGEVVYV